MGMLPNADFTKIIDLSLTLDPELPGTWPGMKEFEHVIWKDFPSDDDPCKTNYFTMDEHCGTHCDAPAHFVKPSGAQSITELEGDRLDLARMQGPLVVIDARGLSNQATAGISPLVERQHLIDWEYQHAPFQKGQVIVIRTGWDRYYRKGSEGRPFLQGPVATKDLPGWPTPSVAALDYLYTKGILCVGIDAPSIGAVHSGIAPHQYGLSRRMIFIEGLANLGEVPETGAFFLFLPIRLGHSTGCPGRAVAYV